MADASLPLVGAAAYGRTGMEEMRGASGQGSIFFPSPSCASGQASVGGHPRSLSGPSLEKFSSRAGNDVRDVIKR